MNRSKIIITSVALVVLIIAGATILNLRQKNPETSSQVATETDGLFPAGELRPSDIANPNPGSTNLASSTDTDETNTRPGRFSRVTTKPVGGVITVGQATSSAVIYVEKATGHLYRLGDSAAGPERISNTTIPKIYRLLGGQNASSTQIIFQYLKDNAVQTFSGQLKLSSSTLGENFLNQTSDLEPLSGLPLSQSVRDLAISPRQDQLFTLESAGNDNIGYISKMDGGKKEVLFHSTYPEWRATWTSSSTIALSTKPGFDIPGALFLIDLKTKKWSQVMSGVPGLTALMSPRLDQAIYSGYSQGGLVFGFYDIKQRFFGRLNIRTWADKCVWNQTGTVVYCAVPTNLPANHRYPDDWYRGEVDLADNIWKIDAVTKKAEIIFSPSTANLGSRIDASNLIITPDESTLYLVNRRDNNLWSLSLQSSF